MGALIALWLFCTTRQISLFSSAPVLNMKHAVHFDPDPEILIKSYYSLSCRVRAEIFFFFAFISTSLNSSSILFSPFLPLLSTGKSYLVRATCLWLYLKIRFPIKPWKVECEARMCVCVRVVVVFVSFVLWRISAVRAS